MPYTKLGLDPNVYGIVVRPVHGHLHPLAPQPRTHEAPGFLVRKPMGPDFVQLGDIASDAGGAAFRIGGVGIGAFLSPAFGIPAWMGAVGGYLLGSLMSKVGGGD